MLVFDALVDARPWGPRSIWGPIDSCFHGVVAALVVLPGAFLSGQERNQILGTCVLAAMVIDLDHFVAAGSLRLEAATTLDCRPWSHSLTAVVAVAFAIRWWIREPAIGAAVLAGLASHVLRDAGGGGCTPIFWPAEIYHVPYWSYVLGTLLLSNLMTMGASGMGTSGEP